MFDTPYMKVWETSANVMNESFFFTKKNHTLLF